MIFPFFQFSIPFANLSIIWPDVGLASVERLHFTSWTNRNSEEVNNEEQLNAVYKCTALETMGWIKPQDGGDKR